MPALEADKQSRSVHPIVRLSRVARLTRTRLLVYEPLTNSGASSGAPFEFGPHLGLDRRARTMKIKNSLKALKGRHRDNRMVRRKGRIYIINKTAPRYKARQG